MGAWSSSSTSSDGCSTRSRPGTAGALRRRGRARRDRGRADVKHPAQLKQFLDERWDNIACHSRDSRGIEYFMIPTAVHHAYGRLEEWHERQEQT